MRGQCGSRGAVKSLLEELVCELLAEAFVKGGCTDKDVFSPHFDHGYDLGGQLVLALTT